MVAAFRLVWKLPYPNITIEHAALMTALYGIWIPGVAACLGGLTLHLLFATPWLTGTQQWWSSHTSAPASERAPVPRVHGSLAHRDVDCRARWPLDLYEPGPAEDVGLLRGGIPGDAARWLWTHVIAQIESLEARQLAEQTLAAERDRLTTTLGAISDAVITTDADTRISYITAAMHDSLTGLSNRIEFQERLREAFLKSRHLNPGRPDDEKSWLAGADTACYQAKKAGRGQLISV